jgi:hypothetical protein
LEVLRHFHIFDPWLKSRRFDVDVVLPERQFASHGIRSERRFRQIPPAKDSFDSVRSIAYGGRRLEFHTYRNRLLKRLHSAEFIGGASFAPQQWYLLKIVFTSNGRNSVLQSPLQ